MTRARATPRRWAVGVAVAGLALLGGCTSGSGGAAATSTVGPSGPATTAAVPTVVTAVGPASTATTPPQPIGPSSTTGTAPPSPTGVPGIDADDEFCAAWARYGGTIQIVAVAVNFGELDDMAAAQLELASAPSVIESVAEIEATWPADIAAERDVAVDRYLGPYQRRADKAVRSLEDAGVDAAGQAQLRDLWADVLATRNPDEPTVTLDLPDPLAAAVGAAATAFDAAVTPWGADPSLTTDLDEIPATKAYLAAHCTDLASIGIGDDI